MHLCIPAINRCQTLTWKGDHYDGAWDGESDTITIYKVEQWLPTGIRMTGRSLLAVGEQRQQIPGLPISVGKKTYIEAVFTGVIGAGGDSVEEAVEKWRMGSKSGELIYKLSWEADHGADAPPSCTETNVTAPPLPTALKVCDGACITQQNGNSAAWVFQGSKGTGVWAKNGIRADLVIQEWESNKVVIIRHDTPDSSKAGASAVYEGTLCGDRIEGNRIEKYPGHYDRQVMPFIATIPLTQCDSIVDDPLRLKDVGEEALRFRQLPSAFKCLSRSADLGDMESRTATGLMYRDGVGVKTDFGEAMRRFQQGAIQGDYNSEVALSEMYDLGLGVPEDPAKAKFWEQKAYNNPIKVAQRQQAAQQAQAQQLLFMGLSAMVEAMSRPDVYVVY
jgi:hypothetical protein